MKRNLKSETPTKSAVSESKLSQSAFTTFSTHDYIGKLEEHKLKWNEYFRKMKESYSHLHRYYKNLSMTRELTLAEINNGASLLMKFVAAQAQTKHFLNQLQDQYGKPLPEEANNPRPKYALTADGERRLGEWAQTVREYEELVRQKREAIPAIRDAFLFITEQDDAYNDQPAQSPVRKGQVP